MKNQIETKSSVKTEIFADWKDSEELIKGFEKAYKKMGLYTYPISKVQGYSAMLGLVVSNKKLTKKDWNQIADGGNEDEDIMMPCADWKDKNGLAEELVETVKYFGGEIMNQPRIKGSDMYGFVVTTKTK